MSLAVIQADCKKALGLLTHLTNDELDEIINDDEKIENLLNEFEQSYLKDIEAEKETYLASNSSLSEFNLTREPELVEGRGKVEALSVEAAELASTVEEKAKELREKAGDTSLETTLALLQTAASESEEESDGLAQTFLDGEVELDDFVDQFLAKRKIMHTRLVKADKMGKILSRDMSSYSNIPNYINAPPVSINSNYFPGIPGVAPVPAPSSVPYPIGPLNMPMPGNMNYFQNHY